MRKKVFSIILFFSVPISLIAQNKKSAIDIPVNRMLVPVVMDDAIMPVTYKTTNASVPPTERWYNYGETMDLIQGNGTPGTSKQSKNYLFPDTTILARYGDDGGPYIYDRPLVHNLGDILDVTSANFNNPNYYADQLSLSKTSSFRLDSIFFKCIYQRKTNTSIVDTLAVEVAVDSLRSEYAFVGDTINAFVKVDTIFLKVLPYSYTTNSLNIASKKIYKIPLTDSTYTDSSKSGIHTIRLATTGLATILPKEYVVAAVSFIPGYSWNDSIAPYNDSLNNRNSILFLSYKEQVNGPPAYTKRDYNISFIVSPSVRYNMSPGVWNGEFRPSFAFMGNQNSPWPFEHHRINYKVTCLSGCSTVSTNELEAIDFMNGIKLFQNQPNPANGSTLISYELGESSSVTLSIYDITGKKVMTLDEGKKPAGKHSVTINQNLLKSGIYLYSLAGNSGNSLTKKMIITD